ncbi:MAG: DsrE family protein [Desulfobacteraceae bacterium]
MSNQQETALYLCTSGGENPEKASICLAMASAAIALDIDTTIAFQGGGVYLALKNYTDHVPAAGGFSPLKKLINDFTELGGKMLVCKPCMEERHIKDTDLFEGAEVTSGGTLNMIAIKSDIHLVY